MFDDIGQKLAVLRREAGLSQKETAAKLEQLGETITDKALSKWEKGATQPSARQFLLLCQVLGVTDISAEFLPGSAASGLDAAGRRKLAEYAMLLRRSGLYNARRSSGRSMRLYTMAVSAGTGQFLDDDDYTLVSAEDAPEEAEFAVCVAGDSMEPRYHDGQTVYVRQQQTLSDGEVGLFWWEGCAYIKVLRDRVQGVALHSLNPAYEDIKIPQPTRLRIFGKVLS